MSLTAALLVAVIALCAMCSILLYCFLRAVNRIVWLQEDMQQVTDTEHAKCIGAVMAYVGDQFAAQILEVAADDYASAQSHGGLDRISRLVYKAGGPPIPTLWLRERAERLRVSDDGLDDPAVS